MKSHPIEALRAYFELKKAGVTISTEMRAALTTFLTMAYILFVNPSILAQAIQLEDVNIQAQLLSATALAAAIGSIMMGLLARYPFALAPGMGLNAYFTFGLVIGEGVAWQTALGAVFISGLIFLILSLSGARQAVMACIPLSLRLAIGGGIGIFLAVIGVTNAGILQADASTLISFGSFASPAPALATVGLLITTAMLVHAIPGAILLGIAISSLLAILLGLPVFAGLPFEGIAKFVSWPVLPTDLFLAMDVWGAFQLGLIGSILALLLVDFFDTAGTLVGLAERSGYLDENGQLPRSKAAYSADAIATMASAVVGTSPTTTYIESAAGIEDGARTGLAAVFVGIFFLLSLFFWPLATAVPKAATAPALILVGFMMMRVTRRISWSDPVEALPAFLILIGIPLSYSIAKGLALGLSAYIILSLLTGRARSMHWLMYLLLPILLWHLF